VRNVPFRGGFMQKLIPVVLLVVFLAASSGVFAQGQGTGMLFLPQPDSPAALVETTHGNKDLLQAAKLQNRSSELIVGYRIGWIAVYPSGKEKVGLGLPVDLPLGVRPGTTIDVPAQGVSTDYAKEGAIALIFFVTDVRTPAPDGATAEGVWRPALEKFEEQALSITKSAILPAR
jgi:hypothetical protein